jgi:hypothetical protein
MTLMKTDTVNAATIEQVLISGDLNRLTAEQRNIYYKSVCDSLGLNPLTRPFDYIVLNGKLTLYARKDCTDQLRSLRGISIRIVSREAVEGVMVVTAQATDKVGRIDESTGAVSVQGLRGEALANALMKAETKAKRRATLSICGLGFTDESEVESIPNARVGEPRAADRILAHQDPAMPMNYKHAVVETVQPQAKALEAATKPEVAPAAAASPEQPRDGDSGVWVIDIGEIEEHRGKGGAVWKIVAANGEVFACTDDLLVSDISEAKNNDHPVRVEWQKRGTKRVILAAQEVTE